LGTGTYQDVRHSANVALDDVVDIGVLAKVKLMSTVKGPFCYVYVRDEEAKYCGSCLWVTCCTAVLNVQFTRLNSKFVPSRMYRQTKIGAFVHDVC